MISLWVARRATKVIWSMANRSSSQCSLFAFDLDGHLTWRVSGLGAKPFNANHAMRLMSSNKE